MMMIAGNSCLILFHSCKINTMRMENNFFRKQGFSPFGTQVAFKANSRKWAIILKKMATGHGVSLAVTAHQ